MGKFIENVNAYIQQYNIKRDIILLRTNWSQSKVSRILNGIQDINESEMDLLSEVFGKTKDYFICGQICQDGQPDNGIAFFAGEPEGEQLYTAYDIIDMLKTFDVLVNIGNKIQASVKG